MQEEVRTKQKHLQLSWLISVQWHVVSSGAQVNHKPKGFLETQLLNERLRVCTVRKDNLGAQKCLDLFSSS